MLNFELQGKKIRLGHLRSADTRLHPETEILEKNNLRNKPLTLTSIKLLLYLKIKLLHALLILKVFKFQSLGEDLQDEQCVQ